MDKDFLIWQLYMCSKGPINISYTMAQYIYVFYVLFNLPKFTDIS
jgi:hypothetical protein